MQINWDTSRLTRPALGPGKTGTWQGQWDEQHKCFCSTLCQNCSIWDFTLLLLQSWKDDVCTSTGMRSRNVQLCRDVCPSLSPFPSLVHLPLSGNVSPTVQRQQNSKFVYVVKKTQNCLTLCRDSVKSITFLHFKHSLQTTNRLVAWINICSLPLNPLHIFSSPSLLPKIKGLHSEFLKLCSSVSLH